MAKRLGPSMATYKGIQYAMETFGHKSVTRALKPINTEDEVIKEASRMLGISQGNIIRKCVSLLEKERWFTDMVKKMGENTKAYMQL